ncbi:diguanylate cyclase [Aeromonas enteropelogenes]|uniref:GGDEF domain-containing protein n=1 Tax=Aeromonas enteropelogenes TaxID=29489 RepID=UPI0005AAAF57|nr:GGDEF domain-containing protein [Aeromonas enteropelogenes]UBH56039.1 GGDEF domain-containing protein [Aeromonas enteropelogenes]
MTSSYIRLVDRSFRALLGLTLAVILLFEFGPERVLDLQEWPVIVTVQRAADVTPEQARYLSSPEGKPGVQCILPARQHIVPGCRLTLPLTLPDEGIDLARFDTLHVRLSVTGEGGQDWRLYLRNHDPASDLPEDPLAPKFNEIIFRPADYGRLHKVPLDVFAPATWWIKQYNVPLQQQGPDLHRVYAIELAAGYDMQPGTHGAIIEELHFHGPWLDASLFYRLILAVWFIYGCIILVANHLHMKQRLQHAHQARLAAEEHNRTLCEESRRSREEATHDPLTGAFNRLGGEELLKGLGERAFSLIYLDVDHFKQINDGHGHPVGDEVLKHLVSQILRHCDTFCHLVRWGGEEFVLICLHYDQEQACALAERLRLMLAADPHWPEALRVTVSFGVAERAGDPLEQVIRRADAALYQAKQRGRNRVETSSPVSPSILTTRETT